MLQASGRRDDNLNCDAVPVYRAIFDRGLGTDLELAFHFGVAVNQEFDGLALLPWMICSEKAAALIARLSPMVTGCRG